MAGRFGVIVRTTGPAARRGSSRRTAKSATQATLCDALVTLPYVNGRARGHGLCQMGEVYKELLTLWKDNGGELFVHSPAYRGRTDTAAGQR